MAANVRHYLLWKFRACEDTSIKRKLYRTQANRSLNKRLIVFIDSCNTHHQAIHHIYRPNDQTNLNGYLIFKLALKLITSALLDVHTTLVCTGLVYVPVSILNQIASWSIGNNFYFQTIDEMVLMRCLTFAVLPNSLPFAYSLMGISLETNFICFVGFSNGRLARRQQQIGPFCNFMYIYCVKSSLTLLAELNVDV